jgi:hypothetical protein
MNHLIGCLIPAGALRKLRRAWMQMSRRTLFGHHRDTKGGSDGGEGVSGLVNRRDLRGESSLRQARAL